jgi:hypothetical protein
MDGLAFSVGVPCAEDVCWTVTYLRRIEAWSLALMGVRWRCDDIQGDD